MPLPFAVEASCDLPRNTLETFGIPVIPCLCQSDKALFTDSGSVKDTLEFHKSNPARLTPLLAPSDQAYPILAPAISALAKSAHPQIVILTSAATFSKTNLAIRDLAFQQRDSGQAKIKIVDSQCILSGYGLVAYEVIRQITERALPVEKVSDLVMRHSQRIHTFFTLTHDEAFAFLCNNHELSGLDQKPSWLQLKKMRYSGQAVSVYHAQKKLHFEQMHHDANQAIQHLLNRVMAGLKTGQYQPRVNISLAMSRSEIRTHQAVNDFIAMAQQRDVKVSVDMMSITGSSLVGNKAMSVSVVQA